MNASRYSMMTVRAEGVAGAGTPVAVGGLVTATGCERKLMATRAIKKTAMSPSSSSGVTMRYPPLSGRPFSP